MRIRIGRRIHTSLIRYALIFTITVVSASVFAELSSYDDLEKQSDAAKLARVNEAKKQLCAKDVEQSAPASSASSAPKSVSRCNCGDRVAVQLCALQKNLSALQEPTVKTAQLEQLKREVSYLESKTYLGRLTEAIAALTKLKTDLEAKLDPKLNEQIQSYQSYINVYQEQLMIKKTERDAAEKEEAKKNAANGVSEESARLENKLRQLEAQTREDYRSEIQTLGSQACGMSLAESMALHDYAGLGFSEVNAALRLSGHAANQYLPFVEVLTSALTKLHPYDGLVLRGTNLPASAKEKYVEGAVVEEPAFTSSSLTRGFAARDRMLIQSRAGHYISPFLSRDVEDEVLFPPGTKFKVLSVKPRTNGGSNYILEEVAN